MGFLFGNGLQKRGVSYAHTYTHEHIQRIFGNVSLVAQRVNNLPEMRETGFNPWVRKIPLVKGMAIHSGSFAWRMPWIEEPGRLQPTGHKESDRSE